MLIHHGRGSVLLSRLWNNYPQYFLSLVFLAVPYTPPGPFDLDAVNAMTEEFFGYPIYGYWKFFNEPDAADVLARHVRISGLARDGVAWVLGANIFCLARIVRFYHVFR
jgi:soluble epoxide hydrolase/lipid-phosphate phosphatase